jgi:hypothetical protein
MGPLKLVGTDAQSPFDPMEVTLLYEPGEPTLEYLIPFTGWQYQFPSTSVEPAAQLSARATEFTMAKAAMMLLVNCMAKAFSRATEFPAFFPKSLCYVSILRWRISMIPEVGLTFKIVFERRECRILLKGGW